jgi:hypothetical protein
MVLMLCVIYSVISFAIVELCFDVSEESETANYAFVLRTGVHISQFQLPYYLKCL